MRIWADMSAPAHVLVLRPIIERLRERGHEVVVTSRDYTQTQELLALHGMEHPTLEEKAWRASEPHTPHDSPKQVGHVPGAALLNPC